MKVTKIAKSKYALRCGGKIGHASGYAYGRNYRPKGSQCQAYIKTLYDGVPYCHVHKPIEEPKYLAFDNESFRDMAAEHISGEISTDEFLRDVTQMIYKGRRAEESRRKAWNTIYTSMSGEQIYTAVANGKNVMGKDHRKLLDRRENV